MDIAKRVLLLSRDRCCSEGVVKFTAPTISATKPVNFGSTSPRASILRGMNFGQVPHLKTSSSSAQLVIPNVPEFFVLATVSWTSETSAFLHGSLGLSGTQHCLGGILFPGNRLTGTSITQFSFDGTKNFH